jgi:hypothetical protein
MLLSMCGSATVGDLAQALLIAIRVHAGQVDKQGAPYLLHVLRVTEAVSVEAKVVAALHDVIEDGDYPDWAITYAARLSLREMDALKLLTRGDGVRYDDYIARLSGTDRPAIYRPAGCDLAIEVKLADLRDNLSRIPTGTVGTDNTPVEETHWGSLRKRYERALTILEAAC